MVLFKKGKGIIQRMVQDSGYYSKHDLQRLVQHSAYYSKYELQRLVHYSGYYLKHDLQRLVQDSAYYSKYGLQRLVHHSGYYSKDARVIFSVWFRIQGIIQNPTCSAGSGFSVLFKIRAAESGSFFRLLFKNGQDILQRMVQYSGYY